MPRFCICTLAHTRTQPQQRHQTAALHSGGDRTAIGRPQRAPLAPASASSVGKQQRLDPDILPRHSGDRNSPTVIANAHGRAVKIFQVRVSPSPSGPLLFFIYELTARLRRAVSPTRVSMKTKKPCRLYLVIHQVHSCTHTLQNDFDNLL